jgi:hypothetical protein
MTETIAMPKQVFHALKVVLDEVNRDIEDALDFWAKECGPETKEYGHQLTRALRLVVAWYDYPTMMTPDDIRDSLEESDRQWNERTKQEAA